MEWNGEGVPVNWGKLAVGGGEPNACSSSSSSLHLPPLPPPPHKLRAIVEEQYEPLMNSKFLCLNSHLSIVILSRLGKMSRIAERINVNVHV